MFEQERRVEIMEDGGFVTRIGGSGGGSGGGGGAGGGDGGEESSPDDEKLGERVIWPLGAFMEGWKARVKADPQFPFKILTEEVIGVGASVVGDMASRPNFGLGELDFVFSTMVVCCIVNFALMYTLAPTSAAAAMALPGIFASCPPGHMFEHGAYSLFQRTGTFVYKGAVFATVGFSAGLVGTALSTLLLNFRRKLDPNFSLQNKPPPTLLNAATWALQLGVSSNSRYQMLNGLEFSMEKVMNPAMFKAMVFTLRSMNNVVGGMSFVMMARLTGSQQQQQNQDQQQGHQDQQHQQQQDQQLQQQDQEQEQPKLNENGVQIQVTTAKEET